MACYEDLRQLYAATAKERDELKKELVQVKAERDKAVSDMGRMIDCCKACVHENDAAKTCTGECEACEQTCACYSCLESSGFQWRGLKC